MSRLLDRSLSTRLLPAAIGAVALAAALTGCAGEPVDESLRLEFLREHESDDRLPFSPEPDVRMEIEADITLNRRRGDDDNEAFRRRMDEVAAELLEGNSSWHRRFDRLQGADADGIDLIRKRGELSQYRLWAVMPDPDPALRAFLSDAPIDPSYRVGQGGRNQAGEPLATQTVTLTFTRSGESRATANEVTAARRQLLEVARELGHFRNTVDELWAYLEENPDRQRQWVRALFFGDEEWGEEDLSEYEEVLLDRLGDGMALFLVPGHAVPEGEPFTLHERLRKAYDPFPGVLTVRPDGAVIEAVGFVETEGGYTASAADLSRAVTDVLDEIVSPNFVAFWEELYDDWNIVPPWKKDAAEKGGCDMDCHIDAVLAQPFIVRPADERGIAERLETALAPLEEYRLSWIRSR